MKVHFVYPWAPNNKVNRLLVLAQITPHLNKSMTVFELWGVLLLAVASGLPLDNLQSQEGNQQGPSDPAPAFCSVGLYRIITAQNVNSAQAERLCRSNGFELAHLSASNMQSIGETLTACLGPVAEAWIKSDLVSACANLRPLGNGQQSLVQRNECGPAKQLPAICIDQSVAPKMAMQQLGHPRGKHRKHGKGTKSHRKKQQSFLNGYFIGSQDEEVRDPRARRGDASAIEKPYLTKPYRGPNWKPADRREKSVRRKYSNA